MSLIEQKEVDFFDVEIDILKKKIEFLELSKLARDYAPSGICCEPVFPSEENKKPKSWSK